MIHTLITPKRVILAGEYRIAEIERHPGYWITIGYIGGDGGLMVNSKEELDEVIAMLEECKKHLVPEELRDLPLQAPDYVQPLVITPVVQQTWEPPYKVTC